MVLAVAVVQNATTEAAEAARQVGDRDDAHAHLLSPTPPTFVVGFALEDLVDEFGGKRRKFLRAGRGSRRGWRCCVRCE